MKCFATIFCLFIYFLQSNAQQWVVQYIGGQDGLQSPDVYEIFQDRRSFIWIGSTVGLSRYDGHSFTNYTHSYNNHQIGRVNSIVQNVNNGLWIGSKNGLFLFEKGNVYKINVQPLQINVLLLDHEGSLWLGTDSGLFWLATDSIYDFKDGEQRLATKLEDQEKILGSDMRITDLKESPKGDLLISTYYFISRLIDGKLTRIWGSENHKPDIQQLTIEDDQRFYWACDESYFYRYDQGEVMPISTDIYNPVDIVYQEKSIWLLTHGYLYNSKDGRISQILEDDEGNGWFRKMLIDDEQNIWLAGWEGLIKMKTSSFEINVFEDQLFSNQVFAIGEDGAGALLFGGNKGYLWREEGGSLVPYLDRHPRIVNRAEVFAIHPENDELWLGTGYQGIARIDANGDKTNYTRDQGLADNSRYFYLKDSKNRLWTGGDGGIDRLERSENGKIEFENVRYEKENFSYAIFTSAVEVNDDQLYFASLEGLFLLKKNQLISANIQDFDVAPLSITQMIKDRNNDIWISTLGEGILQCASDASGKLTLKKQWTIKDGLGSNVFLCILADHNNNIWAGDYQSIVRISHQDHNNVRLYNEADGMLTSSYMDMCLYQDKNHRIWGGTSSGVFSFQPDSMHYNMVAPKVVITQFDLLNQSVEKSHRSGLNYLGIPLQYDLSYKDNDLVIGFSAIGFSKPKSIRFKYKLNGWHNSWQYADAQNKSIRIENLSPGNYRFQILAANEDDTWSVEHNQLTITIRAPFWSRPWFKFVIAISLLTIGLLIYNQILARQRKKSLRETANYFRHSHNAESSVDEILWDVARNVISRLNFEDCVIYMFDQNKQSLLQKAAFGPKNYGERSIQNPIEIKLNQGIVGSAAAQRRTILLRDTVKDDRYIVDLQANRSELAVPIVYENKLLGVIDSEHSKKGFFKKEHADLFELIAELTGHKIFEAQAKEEIAVKEKALLNMEKEMAELKLTALQAQMNPHFIYNSLNSINYYIIKSQIKEASGYLSKFSKLIRLILNHSRHLTVPLNKELEALRLYIELESMRFNERFTYEIQTDAVIDLEEVYVPPLILQPFVENAIWHGLMHKEGPGNLLVQIYPESNHLKCIVQDNGIGRSASYRMKNQEVSSPKSAGLQLTSDRIRLLHDDYLSEDSVHIIDLVDANNNPLGTRVEVLLPYEEE